MTSINVDSKLLEKIEKYARGSNVSTEDFAQRILEIFVSPISEKGRSSFSTARSDFFWKNDLIDFNTGMIGSSPKRVIGKVMEYLYDLGRNAGSGQKMCNRLEKEEETCRKNFASAFSVGVDEVLFESNTTKSLRLAYDIVSSLKGFSETGKIVTTDIEHDSIRRLLRIESRLKVKEVPLLSGFRRGYDEKEIVDLFDTAVDSQTRILLLSHIPYLGGKLPIAEIIKRAKKRSRNIYCVVDGAHALGQIRIDAKEIGCDFYGVGVHKFCLGMPTLGALYAKREYLNELSSDGERLPVFDCYGAPKAFRPKEELGTISGTALVAFNEAFDLLFRGYGIDNIQTRISMLAKYFVECVQQNPRISMISPASTNMLCGVQSIRLRDIDSYEGYTKLARVLESKYGIICKALSRPPCLRICLHYFSTENDISRFFEALNSQLR
jgi:L-cysteine/cystine lyase